MEDNENKQYNDGKALRRNRLITHWLIIYIQRSQRAYKNILLRNKNQQCAVKQWTVTKTETIADFSHYSQYKNVENKRKEEVEKKC